MALILAPNGRPDVVDPTTSLRTALSDFESLLTEEQRRQYENNPTKPDAASVIRFVAELDANNQSRGRRCVASRLCTFLDATQQFVGVVDTFVSSNPIAAALVWGGVKTAILVASHTASYFEKVTNMIMDIGKSSPVYAQFGPLYPGCLGLQGALCDYYAAVVRICHKIVQVSQRTAATQFLSSVLEPFESAFKELRAQLDYAVRIIHLQVSLASKQAAQEMAKLSEFEAKQNTFFRQTALKFQSEARREQEDARKWRLSKSARDAAKWKSSIKDKLSTIKHMKPWRQALQQRAPSTAQWFRQNQAFLNWSSTDKSTVLWCPGTMGIGKTVLVSAIVGELHQTRSPDDIISHFFCRSDDERTLNARNIMGSIARQLLESIIESTEDDRLIELDKKCDDLDCSDLVDLIISESKDYKIYYIVLDGLDECKSHELNQMAQSIKTLCHQPLKHIKILIAGRPELESQLLRQVVQKLHKMPLTRRLVSKDIDHYVDVTLTERLDDERLKLSDPALILKIAGVLQQESDGMFLWARLFIDELCAFNTDNEISEALCNPPRGLQELLDQKLNRLRCSILANYAIKSLQICSVTKRPLTTHELQEILSVEPGQTILDRHNMPKDLNRIVRECCGLIFVDEEDDTVHHAHHSITKYILTNQNFHVDGLIHSDINLYFGKLCLTYLMFNDFKTQLAKVSEGSNVQIPPLQLGVVPVIQSHRSTGRLAQVLLRNQRQIRQMSTGELERKTQEILGVELSKLPTDFSIKHFQFLEYARIYWVYHLSDLNPDKDTKLWKLFGILSDGHDEFVSRPWDSGNSANTNSDDASLIGSLDALYDTKYRWAVDNKHRAVIIYQTLKTANTLVDYLKPHLLKLVFHRAGEEDCQILVAVIIQYADCPQAILEAALKMFASQGRINLVPLFTESEVFI